MAAQVFAQGGATGAITGTVQDPSGAVVPGAQVKIINQDTTVVARTLKTDAKSPDVVTAYAFDSLGGGNCPVR